MTGAEATLLAGLIGGGSAVLAAGLATLGTYRATQRSLDSQVDRDREERRVEAYIDLLWLVHSVMAWVEDTRPRVRLTNVGVPPEIPAADEVRDRARVQALGTPAVRSRLQEWRDALTSFRFAVGELDQMAGSPDAGRPNNVPVEMWQPISQEMNQGRDKLRELTRALEDAIRSELSGIEVREPDSSTALADGT